MITILWERGSMVETLTYNMKDYYIEINKEMREYLVCRRGVDQIVRRFPAERIFTIKISHND